MTIITFLKIYLKLLQDMDSDSKVSKVEKLTATLPAEEAIDIDETVALDFGDTIKNCTIGQGKLTFKITFPANWTGVNVDFNGSLSGALDIADLDMETDLSNKVIDMTNKSVNYKGKISASFENADIIFFILLLNFLFLNNTFFLCKVKSK